MSATLINPRISIFTSVTTYHQADLSVVLWIHGRGLVDLTYLGDSSSILTLMLLHRYVGGSLSGASGEETGRGIEAI